MNLVFGWRTAILAVAAAILLPLAAALWRSRRNRSAARTLAAALVVLVGVFTPWLIGFADFYDEWRWLTFAPLSNALFVPALLYLHSRVLTHGRWPARAWRHLAPGGAQFAYQAACFALPPTLTHRWADVSFPCGKMIQAVLLAGSFAIYGRALLRMLARYRRALKAERSDDALFAGSWLGASTVAFATLAVVWAGNLLWNAVSPLGYQGLMPLYAAIAGFALYLGIAGWHFLAIPFPTFAELAPPGRPGGARDWEALGRQWGETTRREGWHRREALTLRTLAALLGTNASYLSRALNEGLGVNFSDFVNGMRCDEVAATLRAGTDRPVLDLAYEAGFASKSSFNRCFRNRFGVAPSAMRSAGSQIT